MTNETTKYYVALVLMTVAMFCGCVSSLCIIRNLAIDGFLFAVPAAAAIIGMLMIPTDVKTFGIFAE